MGLIKRKENYTNPVSTAMRNFFAIGFLVIIIGFFLLFSFLIWGLLTIVYGMIWIITAKLLNRNNIWGIYLGGILIVLGLFSTIKDIITNNDLQSFIALAIVLYLAYWNYKAHKFLRNIAPLSRTEIKS